MTTQSKSGWIHRLRTSHRDYLILVILAIILPIVPLFTTRFELSLGTLILYWAFLGTAWNIMGGYAGQFSFGHSAFFGIGAYTSTVLYVDYGLSPWFGMLVGALFAATFGAFMGFLTFRFGIKGHFFALATFAFAEMLRLIASDLEFVNKSIGIHIPLIGGDSWALMQFDRTPANYYYVILAFMLIGTLISILIARGKLGYYLQAIRENEEASAALGVDTLRYKITAVAISGGMTAIGGAFFAQYFLFVDPTIAFGVAVSIEILLRPIVGGAGTIWGPLVGSLLLTPLEEFTRNLVRTPPEFLSFIQGRSGVDVMIFGILLIIVVIYMPDGIVGTVPRLWQKINKRFRS